MTQIVSINDLLRERREKGDKRRVARLTMPVGEMITTAQGLMDLVEKVRIDVEFGQADVPLLYQPLYETVERHFPAKTVQLGENTLQADVVFLEKFEGGEVQFGTLQKGVPAQVTLQTYAAGFEWTEDMEVWDNTWDFELVNRAFGRAYNALLNHLHLFPIITPTVAYAGDNLTAADATGANKQEKTLITFQNAYKAAVNDTPQRTWSWLLASESDRFQIEDALLTPVLDAQGNPLPRVPIEGIIYYDGFTIQKGVKQYVYPGVAAGSVYAIFPRQRFKELVEHGLRIDADNRDISRLVQAQVVGRTRRGLYADVHQSVQKITLPA